MSSTNPNIVTRTAAAAINAFTGVKLDSSGQWAQAGAGEAHVAIALYTVASGEKLAAELRNGEGTRKITVAGAVAINARLWGAASGKANDVPLGAIQYVAMEAATADGDIIQVRPAIAGVDDVLTGTITADATDDSNDYVTITHAFEGNPRGVEVYATNAAGTTGRVIANVSVQSATTIRVAITTLTATDIVYYKLTA